MPRDQKINYDITATDSTARALASVRENLTAVNSAVMSVKTMFLGLAPVLTAGAGLTAFLKHAIMVRSALDDMSDTTGDNVRTLDGLRRVAEVAGVEMDQLTGAMSKLARNMNSADDDGKAAGEAIKSLGLDIDSVRAKKPGEAMLEIALALNKFEDGAAKVAVATALMGREGAKMLPYLKDLAEEGELHGRITAEQAAQAEKLEKEWRRLNLTLQDSKDAIASAAIPALSDWISANNEALRIAGSVTEALRLFVFDLNAMTTEKPVEEIGRLTRALAKLQEAKGNPTFGRFVDPAGFMGGREDDLKKQINFLKFLQRQEALALPGGDTPGERARFFAKPALEFKIPPKDRGNKTEKLSEFEQLKRQLQDELAKTGELSEAEKTLRMIQTDRRKSITEAEGNILVGIASEIDLKKSLATQDKNRREIEDKDKAAQTEATQREIEQLKTLRDQFVDMIDPVEKFRRQLAQVRKLLDKGYISPEQAAEMEFAIQMQIDGAMGLNKELDKTKDIAEDIGLVFASAASDAMRDWQGVGNLIRKIGVDIAQIIFRDTVIKPLGSAATEAIKKGGGGIFSSIFGNLFGGGGGNAAPSWTPDWSNFTGAYAAGGSFVAGNRMLVGERGPEIVEFNRGGNVIPNDQLGGGGGVTIVNHYNIDSRTDRGDIMAAIERNGQRVVRQVADLNRRGGGFRRALQS